MPRVSSVEEQGLGAVVVKLRRKGRSYAQIADQLGLADHAVKRYLWKHEGHGPRRTRRSDVKSAATSDASPSGMSPVETFEAAFGQEAMPHQREYLEDTRDTVVRKGRQVGMTQAAAGLAIWIARRRRGALAAVVSPSMTQSKEIAVRARLGLWNLGETLVQDSAGLIRLANGSRILSLPGTARSVRGYAVDLLILDEAAWIEEETWAAARPMTVATRGRTVVQSTPGIPSGWFYELTASVPEGWASMHVSSEDIETVDKGFLAREKVRLTPALYAQEYLGEFGFPELEGAALFNEELLGRHSDVEPRGRTRSAWEPGR